MKEIKKYVLLDDKRIVEIYGKTKFGYEYVDSKTENGIVVTRTILEDKIIKSSNNLLDLVEKRDLIEFVDNDIHMVISADEGNFITTTNLFIYKKRDYDKLKSIYKRQPNGDYKRYEVSES
jgi:hypothetical protein